MKKRNRKVTSGSAIEMMRRVTTGIRSLIEYSMSAVFSTDTGEHYLYNSGSSREANNSELFSGRDIVLDATQELPIEVPYTLGGDGSSHTMGLISTGGLTTTDNLDGSYNVAGTVSGANAYIEIIDTSITTSVEILDEFQVIINSGSAAFDRYFDGTSVTALPNGSQTILNGANKVELKNRPSRGAFLYIPDGTTIDMDITPTSIKQITTPANTAITYWDATAKEYVQIGADGVGSSVELFGNGDFSDGLTGWTDSSLTTGSISLVGATVELTTVDSGQYGRLYTSFPTVVGTTYLIDTKRLANSSILQIGEIANTGNIFQSANTSLDEMYEFVAISSTTYVTVLNFNVGTTAVIDSVVPKEALPVSTTYTFTNQSVGEIAPTTKPFDTADIALMNADNQLLGQLALGSTTTGLSLVTADLYGYYPVSELSGALVHDTPIVLGSEELDNATLQANANCTITRTATGIDATSDGLGIDSRPRFEFIGSLVNGKTYQLNVSSITMNSGSGNFYVTLDGVVLIPLTDILLMETFEFVYQNSLIFYFDGTTAFDVSTDMEVKEITSTLSTITNYLSTVRTNGDNSTYGMQLVGFKQDSLGLPTAVADAGTTQWTADGRTATTGWTVTAPFTVTEYVGGATQTIGAEEITNGTFDTDLSSWTFTTWAWATGRAYLDTGASPTVYQYLQQSIPAEGTFVVVSFDYEVTEDVIQVSIGGNTSHDIDLSGSGSYSGIHVVAVGTNITFTQSSRTVRASGYIDNVSVKELIGADIYTFTSDGNRYKNTVADGTYTLPTGEWVLDNTAFDDVTPVTARGDTQLVSSVVIP